MSTVRVIVVSDVIGEAGLKHLFAEYLDASLFPVEVVFEGGEQFLVRASGEVLWVDGLRNEVNVASKSYIGS